MVVIIFQLFLFFSPLSGLTLVFTETNHCIISLEEDDQRKKCAFEGWIDNIVEEGLEEVQQELCQDEQGEEDGVPGPPYT